MRLIYKEDYKSITKFNDVELADFTILTGVNGSGKSHLLEAIRDKKFHIENLDQSNIVLFDSATFILENESRFNIQNIYQQQDSAWDKITSFHRDEYAFGGHGFGYGSPESNEILHIMKDIAIKKNKNMMELQISDFPIDVLEKEFRNIPFKSLVTSYLLQKRQEYLQIKKENPSVYNVIERLDYFIHDITKDDFNSLYEPHTIKNSFLPNQIGKVFWDYYVKHRSNTYDKFRKSEGETVDFLTDEEFVKKYGDKPWGIVNNILASFQNLDYMVNSPEDEKLNYIRDSFKLKLTNILTGVEVNFQDLSSGEKVLMALVASKYKISSDNTFPDILLLDEIDASLHPSMIKILLVDVIKDVFLKNNMKVIMVTHSPSTIALSSDDSIYIMNKSGANRIEKRSKREALAILTEGFATLNDIEPNLSIEYNLSRTDLPILFTEGITDKIIIETAWKKLNPYKEMPFYIQDCFSASFLANLFRRGDDAQDGIFKTYSDKPLIALFDFDAEGYNAWNGLSNLSVYIETNPKKCLSKRNEHGNGFALLLPVPNNQAIEKQVIKENHETFKSKAILSIELLFYGHPELNEFYVKEVIQGGGEIIVFNGKKRNFATKINDLGIDKFSSFVPLFDKLIKIITAT